MTSFIVKIYAVREHTMRIFPTILGVAFSMALTAHAGTRVRGIPDCFGVDQPHPGRYVVMPSSNADVLQYGRTTQAWESVFGFIKKGLTRYHISLKPTDLSIPRFVRSVQPADKLKPSAQLAFRKVLGSAKRKFKLSFSCVTVYHMAED